MDYSNCSIKCASFRDGCLEGAKFNNANAGVKLPLSVLFASISLSFSTLTGGILQLGTATIVPEFYTRPVYNSTILALLGFFFLVIISRGLMSTVVPSILVVISTALLVISIGFKPEVLGEILAGILAGMIIAAVNFIGIIVIAIIGSLMKILICSRMILGVALSATFGVTVASSINTSYTEVIIGTVISLITTFIGCYTAVGVRGKTEKVLFIRRTAIALAAIRGTSFNNANLTSADFTQAILSKTDFRNANLTRTCWRDAKGLEFSRLSNTYLANPKIRQLVVSCDGQGQNFDGLDLTGVNLQEAELQDASFVGASLNQSNLRGADFSRAKLKQTQLEGADLTEATLTGAYIEDWGITSTTKLENVRCEYVFMRSPTQENPNPLRKPDDWEQTFAEGEFADFIQPFFDTLDLYHRQDVDPRAISIALKNLSVSHPEEKLQFVAIERRGNNGLNLRFTTTPGANKSALSHEYFANYADIKRKLPVATQIKLAEQDAEIRTLKGTIEQFIETGTHRSTVQADTIQVIQGELIVTENRGININAGGDIVNVSELVSGDGVVNRGTISGNVTNAINQLPDAPEAADQPSLKALLTQLQQAIQTDTDLPDPDKSDLLEQVQSLAEAKQAEEPVKREGLTRKAMKMFDATLKNLPDTAKIVEACSKLLPLILKALGFPA